MKKTSSKKVVASRTTGTACGKARAVISCHGIGNRPVEHNVRSNWDLALFDSDQIERTLIAYWLDYSRHHLPKAEGTGSLTVEGELGTEISGVDVGPFTKGTNVFDIHQVVFDSTDEATHIYLFGLGGPFDVTSFGLRRFVPLHHRNGTSKTSQ